MNRDTGDGAFWTDAGAGREFIRSQSDAWREQGEQYHREGLPLSACWNEYQRQGWQAQQDWVQGLKLRTQRKSQSACANHEQRFAWRMLDVVLRAVAEWLPAKGQVQG